MLNLKKNIDKANTDALQQQNGHSYYTYCEKLYDLYINENNEAALLNLENFSNPSNTTFYKELRAWANYFLGLIVEDKNNQQAMQYYLAALAGNGFNQEEQKLVQERLSICEELDIGFVKINPLKKHIDVDSEEVFKALVSKLKSRHPLNFTRHTSCLELRAFVDNDQWDKSFRWRGVVHLYHTNHYSLKEFVSQAKQFALQGVTGAMNDFLAHLQGRELRAWQMLAAFVGNENALHEVKQFNKQLSQAEITSLLNVIADKDKNAILNSYKPAQVEHLALRSTVDPLLLQQHLAVHCMQFHNHVIQGKLSEASPSRHSLMSNDDISIEKKPAEKKSEPVKGKLRCKTVTGTFDVDVPKPAANGASRYGLLNTVKKEGDMVWVLPGLNK